MKKLAIGLMSGTSGDGVSLALTSFWDRSFRLLYYETFPYPRFLSNEITRGPDLRLREASRLNVLLGEFFSRAILKFLRTCRLSPSKITVIGSHGQTLYHGPADHPPNTLQVGEASILAERTGIPVVADFRMRDVACGGQGAPLIPFFDQFFFGRGAPQALQNIGGIANVTLVGRRCPPLAFDTGPGNCLIDGAVQKISRGRLRFDPSGKIAARGIVDMKTVRRLAEHPYFRRKPPKSTGREVFNEALVRPYLQKQTPEDWVATLTYFTAATIYESYRKFLPKNLSEIIVSGGGALNETLMSYLSNLCSPVPVRSISTWGIPPQAKEPIAFGFFALRTLEGKINHLPDSTGAAKACILGKIIPANRNHNPKRGLTPFKRGQTPFSRASC